MELLFSPLSFHTVLSGRESVTVCSPHLKRGELRSTSLAGEYLSTWIIWHYSAWELSLLLHLLINLITYLHQHRIMASYFILCVMILNHFMLLLKCFWLWSSGARSVGFCVPWTPLTLCTCFFSFLFFPHSYFLALVEAPGSSYVFPASVLEFTVSPRIPDPCDWKPGYLC